MKEKPKYLTDYMARSHFFIQTVNTSMCTVLLQVSLECSRARHGHRPSEIPMDGFWELCMPKCFFVISYEVWISIFRICRHFFFYWPKIKTLSKSSVLAKEIVLLQIFLNPFPTASLPPPQSHPKKTCWRYHCIYLD